MKKILFAIAAFCFSLGFAVAQSTGNVQIGVYDGRTPCDKLAVQLEENASSDCIKIKWRLTLLATNVNASEGQYEIVGFRYQRQAPRKGNWHIEKGMPGNPDAEVLVLEATDKPAIRFLKADENIFFFLDQQNEVLVGNKDFSYSLNKVK